MADQRSPKSVNIEDLAELVAGSMLRAAQAHVNIEHALKTGVKVTIHPTITAGGMIELMLSPQLGEINKGG
jgi:hypothetical protein